MNNTEFPPKKCQTCWECKKAKYTTYKSGDRCPLCGINTDVYSDDDEECLKYFNATNNDDMTIYYCEDCRIIFQFGCTHAVNGCDENTYYARLVKAYELNGIKYENKMPIFNSVNECYKSLSNYKFEWNCMCVGKCDDCPNAFYKNYQTGCCKEHL